MFKKLFMAKSKTTKKQSTSDELLAQAIKNVHNELKKFAESVDSRLTALEEKPQPTTSNEPVDNFQTEESQNEAGDDAILKMVHERLGTRFSYRQEENQPGVNFKFVLLPPVDIAEKEGAEHVKVIPYAEADSQMALYCDQVFAFYKQYCFKHGINFERRNG